MIGFVSFGNQDTLRFLSDTRVTTQSGQPLCLMAKTTLSSFFLPLALSRQYVWGVITGRDEKKNLIHFRTDSFIPIADGDIAKFQAAGQLPNPLPPIKYSAWDIIPVSIGWFFVSVFVVGSVAGIK